MYKNLVLKPQIFATDLDNTIVSQAQSHHSLWEVIDFKKTFLIYITGRHKQSALALIEQEKLPQPDILVCDVGASIFVAPHFEVDMNWANLIHRNDFTKVEQLADEFNLVKQPIQTNWRRAYFTDAATFEVFKKIIEEQKLEVELIYSGERDLDVLPKGVNKGTALLYLLEKLNFSGNVIIAGDSENDISMFQLGYPAIAVGNACEKIKAMHHEPHIYVATEPASAGIKEMWSNVSI